mgnify:FL=1
MILSGLQQQATDMTGYILLIVIGQTQASMDIGFGATDLNVLTNPRLLNLQKVAPLGELQSHPIGR